MQRDEIVGGDRRARVVERPGVVGELEGLQPEQAGEREASVPRLVRFSRDRREGAVELFRAPRARERLQRVKAEAPGVRIQRRERRAAADVGDPAMAGGQTPGHVPDGRVGNAQKRQLGVLVSQLDPALLEPRGDSRANTAATDHVDGFEHRSAPVP